MGLKALSISVAVIAVLWFLAYRAFYSPLSPPEVDLQKYWGPSARVNKQDSSEVKPFKIEYTEAAAKLRTQLSEPLNLWKPLENSGFDYGFNSNKLEELIKYWRDDYLPRWDSRQKYLNSFPHFKTQIQGLNIHFIHTKDLTVKAKNVVPLLLLHGWPGSIREFYEIIPKLIKAKDDTAYIVVAPSLPGYGFSEAASIPGLNPTEIAVIFRNLMVKLGYNRFLIQGGDWGSRIGATIATLFPENVIGYHSNLCITLSAGSIIKGAIASIWPSQFIPEGNIDFHYPLKEKFSRVFSITGYFHIQATKPDTIGNALTRNPVGLASYILEKFANFFGNPNAQDMLFHNLMIYYLTNTITPSVRLYAEAFSKEATAQKIERVPVKVPTGCARFKNDLAHEFDWQLATKFPQLIHSTYHRGVGHFAAMENPDLLYQDFTEFVQKLDSLQ